MAKENKTVYMVQITLRNGMSNKLSGPFTDQSEAVAAAQDVPLDTVIDRVWVEERTVKVIWDSTDA